MNKDIGYSYDGRLLEYGLLRPYSNIFAFSTTRHGGCSEGNYASFNANPYCGDQTDCVSRNRDLLVSLLPVEPEELVVPHQVHACEILMIDESYLSLSEAERSRCREGVDAVITSEKNCCICVSTADCVPILLYDRTHQVIAAVHDGWRGTVKGLLRLVLHRMNDRFGTEGKDIVACIGPSISKEAFEVGDEVYEAFREAGFPMDRLAERHLETGKWHIDLWEANRWMLEEFSVPAGQIQIAGICTWKNQEKFFSARRLGIASGRMLSGIMIVEEHE